MSDSKISSVRGFLVLPPSDAFFKWHTNSETWAINKYVTSRFGNALLAGPEMATQAIDTVIGMGAAVLNLITAGTSQTMAARTVIHLQCSGNKIISVAYRNLILIINPISPFPQEPRSFVENQVLAQIRSEAGEEIESEPLVYRKGDGLLTDLVIAKFSDAGRWCRSCSNPLASHVGSRLCYLVGLVAALVSRVVDFAIGLIAAIFSIFPCFGRCATLNNTAYRGLQIPGIVSDIFYFLTKAVNPWAISTKI